METEEAIEYTLPKNENSDSFNSDVPAEDAKHTQAVIERAVAEMCTQLLILQDQVQVKCG